MSINFQRHNKKVYVFELQQEQNEYGELTNIYVPSTPAFIYASAYTKSVQVQGTEYPITETRLELRTRYSKNLNNNQLLKIHASDSVLYEIETVYDPDLSRSEMIVQVKTTPIPFTSKSGG